MAQILEHLKTLAKDEVGAPCLSPAPTAHSEHKCPGFLNVGSFWKGSSHE